MICPLPVTKPLMVQWQLGLSISIKSFVSFADATRLAAVLPNSTDRAFHTVRHTRMQKSMFLSLQLSSYSLFLWSLSESRWLWAEGLTGDIIRVEQETFLWNFQVVFSSGGSYSEWLARHTPRYTSDYIVKKPAVQQTAQQRNITACTPNPRFKSICHHRSTFLWQDRRC